MGGCIQGAHNQFHMVSAAQTPRFTDCRTTAQGWFVTPPAITIEMMRFIGESEPSPKRRG
jgi:hypothetical protein